MKRARDVAQAEAKEKEAARAAGASAEGAVVPFEGGGSANPGGTGFSTQQMNDVVSASTGGGQHVVRTSYGSSVDSAQGATALTTTSTAGSSIQKTMARGGRERLSGRSTSNGGSFAVLEPGDVSAPVSGSITTATTDDLPTNVIASG